MCTSFTRHNAIIAICDYATFIKDFKKTCERFKGLNPFRSTVKCKKCKYEASFKLLFKCHTNVKHTVGNNVVIRFSLTLCT